MAQKLNYVQVIVQVGNLVETPRNKESALRRRVLL